AETGERQERLGRGHSVDIRDAETFESSTIRRVRREEDVVPAAAQLLRNTDEREDEPRSPEAAHEKAHQIQLLTPALHRRQMAGTGPLAWQRSYQYRDGRDGRCLNCDSLLAADAQG